jgi:cytoskeletal protein RodZ
MSRTSKKAASASRKARIEEMRRAERARERSNRIITITLSAVIVVGLVGWGAYYINSANEKDEQQAAEVKKPVQGERTWDAKKLGRNHVTGTVKYPMNPPVGGNHHQAWMTCDGTVYTKAIANENAVHSLEHGAVWVTYNDKATEADIKTLSDKVSKTPYTLMSPYKTQSGPVMLSAWGKQLSVNKASDPRVEQFLTKYVQGAQTPEPGAACTGGLTAS